MITKLILLEFLASFFALINGFGILAISNFYLGIALFGLWDFEYEDTRRRHGEM